MPLFLYEWALRGYEYYAPSLNLPLDIPLVRRKELDDMPWPVNKRVWVVFTHVKFDQRLNERLIILNALNQLGTLEDKVELSVSPQAMIPTLENNITASVYLYDLSS